ncbi:response regulator transcription factor [Actinospica sp.]|uniref:response regulator transcription factor n=1 Tax=Actinospica sp. TaxID=1872142 RepID=UPI002BFBD3E7|nr:response regulator transcription factor [Actinospica sp.]HWG24238.1 response regulator transcription factor [Actinospica sp.]
MTLVLVVDDQDLVRAGLAALLRAAPNDYAVTEARDGFEAVRATAELAPDVILMDIRMPGMDGITAIREILAEAERDGREPPRILVLTTFDLDEHVHNALRAGASGFLVKSTPAARLFAAVDAVAAGDLAFTPEITRRLVEAFQQKHDSAADAAPSPEPPAEPDPAPRRPSDELTSRELEVLRMVGTGLSNTDIAAELMLAEATVKTHIYRVMTKLNLASRAQVVVYAYETGLVTPGGQA